MKRTTVYILAVLTVGVFALEAQDDDAPKLLNIGGFDHRGSVTAGYRFTRVKGYEPKFMELFGLQSGFRLLDFDLFGVAQAEGNRYADNYSLTMSGLGGEPYTTSRLTVRKNNLYDLRVNFRQSHYYWNRNDLAALPGNSRSLTSNHDWATVRKLGSANLLLHATRNLRLSFEYYRNTREGMNFTTRSLDYFGASSTWGSFARANPYYVAAPFNEVSNRVTGGMDYARRDWSFHYRLGVQTFEDAIHGNNVTSPERSINIDDVNTAREPVNRITWSDSRRLSTPVSEFSYSGRVTPKFEMRGAYIFYRYRGPAALDFSFDGIARTVSAGTTVAPYAVSASSLAHVTEPNHVVDQGFTYKVTPWWNILLDYRYSRFSVDSSAEFRSVNGPTVAVGESETQWRLGTHTLDFNMTFTPAASLLLRTGVRLLKSDIVALEDGVSDPQRTKRIKTVWPVASVYYQPSKMLTVRADVEQINNGTSYTRITPHIDVGGRLVVRFKPVEKFYIEDSAIVRNRKLLQTDYRSTIRSNSILANYDWNERF